jgi:hypothetical protein
MRAELADSLFNLKLSELTVTDELNRLERDWLVGCLRSKRGVRDALYRDGDAHRLVIEHDADTVSSERLLDFVHSFGLRARVVAPQTAATQVQK